MGAIHPNFLSFGDGLQLSNKKLLLSSELLFNYLIPTKKNGCFSIAASYFIQSSYNKKRDFESIVLTGERFSTHWHYSISHLYRILTANYLIVTYSKRDFAFSIFLREDFFVDNAPDAQVGIGVKVGFK